MANVEFSKFQINEKFLRWKRGLCFFLVAAAVLFLCVTPETYSVLLVLYAWKQSYFSALINSSVHPWRCCVLCVVLVASNGKLLISVNVVCT